MNSRIDLVVKMVELLHLSVQGKSDGFSEVCQLRTSVRIHNHQLISNQVCFFKILIMTNFKRKQSYIISYKLYSKILIH